VCSLNLDEWQPSCSISPCSELHNFALRPAANGREFEHCIWYVSDMEENELETDRFGNWALNVKNYYMYLNAITYQQKMPQRNRATSFIKLMS
jgi:hypothetical protein